MKEMERWKKEAAKVLEPSDKTILESARLYVLLRSLVEKEGLAAISIDCLSFSFSGHRSDRSLVCPQLGYDMPVF